MRWLAPTLHHDFQLINEIAGRADSFDGIGAEVLLQRTLPHACRIDLPGLDHGGSTDRDGKPEVVAPAVRQFFT